MSRKHSYWVLVIAVGILIFLNPAYADPITPTLQIQSPTPTSNGFFGHTVLGISDVDGDGGGDLLIWEPNAGNGTVHIYSGTSGEVLRSYTAPDGVYSFGHSLDAVGDLNGDGIDDVLVGASPGVVYALSGGATEEIYVIAHGAAGFGHCVTGLGDLDGDGVADIAISAPAEGRGEVFVFSGSDGNTIIHHLNVEQTYHAGFGAKILGTPDLDGDSVPDFIVANPGAMKVYVFSGATGTLIYEITGPWGISATPPVIWPNYTQVSSLYGEAMAVVHDMNNDGVADLLIGAPNYGYNVVPWPGGNIDFQYCGYYQAICGATGNGIGSDSGNSAFEHFGSHLASLGDASHDGIGDFILDTSLCIGNPGWGGYLPVTPAPGNIPIPDINGDGIVELALALPSGPGEVHLFYSTPDGYLTSHGIPLNFIKRVPNDPSPLETLYVSIGNRGLGPMEFAEPGVVLEGPDAEDFVISTLPSTDTLYFGNTRGIEVQFDPQSFGSKSANLVAYSTEGGTPSMSLSLSGLGSSIQVLPQVLDFKVAAFPGPTKILEITLTNHGSSPLAFTGEGFAIINHNEGMEANFDFAETPETSPMAPLESRIVRVQFTSENKGDYTGSLHITTTDPYEPTLSVPLLGTAYYRPEFAFYLSTERGITVSGDYPDGESHQWLTYIAENPEMSRGVGYTPGNAWFGGLIDEDEDHLLVRYAGDSTTEPGQGEIGVMRVNKGTGDRELVYRTDNAGSEPGSFFYPTPTGLARETAETVVTFDHLGLTRINTQTGDSTLLASFADLEIPHPYWAAPVNLQVSDGQIYYTLYGNIESYNIATSEKTTLWQGTGATLSSLNIVPDGDLIALVKNAAEFGAGSHVVKFDKQNGQAQIVSSPDASPHVGAGPYWEYTPNTTAVDLAGEVYVASNNSFRDAGWYPFHGDYLRIHFTRILPEIGNRNTVLRLDRHGPLDSEVINTAVFYMLVDGSLPPNDDNDGVNNAIEDAHPNGGDGNNDGIPDSLQSNVVSLPDGQGGYLTIVSPPGTIISRAQLSDPASLLQNVDSCELIFGELAFDVDGDVAPAILVDIFWTADLKVSDYLWHNLGSGNWMRMPPNIPVPISKVIAIDNSTRKLSLYVNQDYSSNALDRISFSGGPAAFTIPEQAVYVSTSNQIWRFDAMNASTSNQPVLLSIGLNPGDFERPLNLKLGDLIIENEYSILARYSGDATNPSAVNNEMGVVRIDKFMRDYTLLYKTDDTIGEQPGYHWFREPLAMAHENESSIVIFDHEGLVRISTDTGDRVLLADYADLGAASYPDRIGQFIDISTDGKLFYDDFQDSPSIVKSIDLDTRITQAIGFDSVGVFVLDVDNSIVATTADGDYLVRFDRDAASSAIIASLPRHVDITGGFQKEYPVALTIAPDRNIYLLSRHDSYFYLPPGFDESSTQLVAIGWTVYRIDPDTGTLTTVGMRYESPGSYDSSIFKYSGIAVDFRIPDDDGDRIPNHIEDSHPNNGDGNGDGIADSLQPHVTSVPAGETEQDGYLTLVGPENTNFSSVTILPQENLDLPEGVELLFVVEFILEGVAPGSATNVDIHWTANERIKGYYKLDVEWYDFVKVGATGVITIDNEVRKMTIGIEDGGRGDSDGVVNGRIVDPGGPVIDQSVITPTSAHHWQLLE